MLSTPFDNSFTCTKPRCCIAARNFDNFLYEDFFTSRLALEKLKKSNVTLLQLLLKTDCYKRQLHLLSPCGSAAKHHIKGCCESSDKSGAVSTVGEA